MSKTKPKPRKPLEFKIEIIPIAELKPHPRNYRIHTEEQLTHLVASVKLHGFYRNIIIARDNTILAGHGIVLAATKLGELYAPVFRVPLDPDSNEALRILIGDNEAGHLAEINDRYLTDMLQELKLSDMLVGTDYDEMMLAGRLFTTRTEDEIKDLDAAKEWLGMPEYQDGVPEIKLVVNFLSEAYRQEFIKKTELKVFGSNRATKTAWYPEKERNDISSIKFEDAK
jgi:ParB-like chromosome segregation protein Spo0J